MTAARRSLLALIAPLSLSALAFSASPALADGRVSLVESTYMDRGSVALAYRGTPIAGRSVPSIAAEWSWQAHPRLGIGLLLGTSVGAVSVEAPDSSSTKDASLVQATLHFDSPVYTWQFLTVAADVEVGTMEMGYRGSFDGAESKWKSDQAAVLGLGVSTYAHISQETDLGLTIGYQRTKGMQLEGLEDGGMAGMSAGIKLRRWF